VEELEAGCRIYGMVNTAELEEVCSVGVYFQQFLGRCCEWGFIAHLWQLCAKTL